MDVGTKEKDNWGQVERMAERSDCNARKNWLIIELEQPRLLVTEPGITRGSTWR